MTGRYRSVPHAAMAASYCQGTIRGMDATSFNSEHAAGRLRKAMKGLGTDEHQIIKVLTEHNNAQRQEIKDKYKSCFGTDLIEDLKGELAGHFESLCLYLLMPARYFDAFCLKNAMKRLGTKESHIIDILVSRSNMEIQDIKTVYKELFQADLEEDIKSEVSGDFQRVLVGLVQGKRSVEQMVEDAAAKADMEDVYNGGEGLRFATEEDVFNKVLVTRSIPHLRKVFELYKEYAGKDIEGAIIGEMSGDTQKAFLAIVNYVKDPLKFFAKCLFESMDGKGTDDERLMQLVVSHSEVDLQDVAEVYEKEYKSSLAQHIREDTSGDYRKLLLQLTQSGESQGVAGQKKESS
ncbi:annexin A5-like isoform X1 [Haliotis asinina]|uniref:annexin A5-like isoform X1 n=2 Tax=Haliotis asinina TaxID=109174 RepID=UPI00353242C6